MKVLVTGFEPFAGLAHNPSGALLELLPQKIAGASVVTATLPVDTLTAPERLKALYDRHRPDATIHLGLALGRPVLSLERLAVNLLDFEIPDNRGNVRRDAPVLEGGPLALHTRLPVRAIQAAWGEQGIPSQISNTAGLYLCNQVMFLALAWLPEAVPAGFIHLPADEHIARHKPQAYVGLEAQSRAVITALEVTLNGLEALEPRAVSYD